MLIVRSGGRVGLDLRQLGQHAIDDFDGVRARLLLNRDADRRIDAVDAGSGSHREFPARVS